MTGLLQMVCTHLYWAPHKIQQQHQCATPEKLALLHLCGSHFSWFNFFEATKPPRLLPFCIWSSLRLSCLHIFEGRISRASHALHYLSFLKLKMTSMCHKLGCNRMLYAILVALSLHCVFYLKSIGLLKLLWYVLWTCYICVAVQLSN